jgi:hypothetical protein
MIMHHARLIEARIDATALAETLTELLVMQRCGMPDYRCRATEETALELLASLTKAITLSPAEQVEAT